MENPFLMFLDHTQRRSTAGRTPLDEWSARRKDLYLTTHDTNNRQMSMPPVGFEPTISAGERPAVPAHLWKRPVTIWAYKPEAANTVWNSWWWAVCRSKHVKPLNNFGIINSITKLHLVGISTDCYIMYCPSLLSSFFPIYKPLKLMLLLRILN